MITRDSLEFHIDQQWDGTVRFYIVNRESHGGASLAKPVTLEFAPMDPSTYHEPTMTMPMMVGQAFLKAVVTEVVNKGLHPKEVDAELKATKIHLNDLRRLYDTALEIVKKKL